MANNKNPLSLNLAEETVNEIVQQAVNKAVANAFSLNLAQEVDTSGVQVELTVDADTIKQYLRNVFDYCMSDGWIAFRSFTEKKNDDQKPVTVWVENSEDGYDKIVTLSQEAANRGMSSYIIPGLVPYGKAGQDDVICQSVIVQDIDEGSIKDKLKHAVEWIGTPSMVIASGGKTPKGEEKHHVYWRLNEESQEVRNKVCALQKHIAIFCESDRSFMKASQPVRIPGTFHFKNTPVLTTIVSNSDCEYELDQLISDTSDMPSFSKDGEKTALDLIKASVQKGPIDDVMLSKVHAEGVDGVTRFDQLSRIMGYWISRRFEGKIDDARMLQEVLDYNEANVIPPWSETRIKNELNRLFRKREAEHGPAQQYIPEMQVESLKAYRYMDLYNDTRELPEDLIEPGLLHKGGFLLISGPPKSLKSFLSERILEAAALGDSFLKFNAPKPLNVFYLQAELDELYLRERMRIRKYTPEQQELLQNNFVVSEKFKWILDEDGCSKVSRLIRKFFPEDNPVDIIAIDPLANVMVGEENDNQAMMEFLRDNLEKIRMSCNKDAGILLCHHANKSGIEAIKNDPFNAGLRGAGSLRGWFSSGMVIAATSTDNERRGIWTEFRYAKSIPHFEIEMDDKCMFHVVEEGEDYSPDKKDYDPLSIEQILLTASDDGRYFNKDQFAEYYCDFFNLKPTTLKNRITGLLKEGKLKYFDGKKQGLEIQRAHKMYLWVDGLVDKQNDMLNNDGNFTLEKRYVKPTHYVLEDGKILPCEK